MRRRSCRRATSPPSAPRSLPSGTRRWGISRSAAYNAANDPGDTLHAGHQDPVAATERPEPVRGHGRRPAAVVPDAADVPVEFTPSGLPADPAERLGEVPLLRRGVHAAQVGPGAGSYR